MYRPKLHMIIKLSYYIKVYIYILNRHLSIFYVDKLLLNSVSILNKKKTYLLSFDKSFHRQFKMHYIPVIWSNEIFPVLFKTYIYTFSWLQNKKV